MNEQNDLNANAFISPAEMIELSNNNITAAPRFIDSSMKPKMDQIKKSVQSASKSLNQKGSQPKITVIDKLTLRDIPESTKSNNLKVNKPEKKEEEKETKKLEESSSSNAPKKWYQTTIFYVIISVVCFFLIIFVGYMTYKWLKPVEQPFTNIHEPIHHSEDDNELYRNLQKKHYQSNILDDNESIITDISYSNSTNDTVTKSVQVVGASVSNDSIPILETINEDDYESDGESDEYDNRSRIVEIDEDENLDEIDVQQNSEEEQVQGATSFVPDTELSIKDIEDKLAMIRNEEDDEDDYVEQLTESIKNDMATDEQAEVSVDDLMI